MRLDLSFDDVVEEKRRRQTLTTRPDLPLLLPCSPSGQSTVLFLAPVCTPFDVHTLQQRSGSATHGILAEK